MYRYSVPSKTFLIGEYGVLDGGPAIIACTLPRFYVQKADIRLIGSENNSKQSSRSKYLFTSFSKESAPGRLQAEYPQVPWADFYFVDPHAGQGGFGASSAQFIFADQICRDYLSGDSKVLSADSVRQIAIWENYRKRSLDNGAGRVPSGVDILAQLHGGLVTSQSIPENTKSSIWPWKHLDFLICRTGVKVETHRHLMNLSSESIHGLADIARHGIRAFNGADSNGFLESIRMFDAAMVKARLYSLEAESRWKNLRSTRGVLAVKGCGAMGADTVVIFCESEYVSGLREKIAGEMLLKEVATSADVSPGFSKEF